MPDLQSLYRDIIMDHYRSPRRRGELTSPPAIRSEGFNPLCGDEVVVTFEVNDDIAGDTTSDIVVSDIAIGGQGCSISQASASMMSEAIVGKSLSEIRELASRFKAMMGITLENGKSEAAVGEADGFQSLGDLEAMRGVIKFPIRIKCATLAWNALLAGLDDLESAANAPADSTS